MNTQAKILIAGLAASVAGLALALGVVLATGDGSELHHAGPYGDMMGAMGNMDPESMLEQMREVAGDESYGQMLAHMAQHGSGTQAGAMPGIDGMMHRMMDGMMQRMPMDSRDLMPGRMH